MTQSKRCDQPTAIRVLTTAELGFTKRLLRRQRPDAEHLRAQEPRPITLSAPRVWDAVRHCGRNSLNIIAAVSRQVIVVLGETGTKLFCYYRSQTIVPVQALQRCSGLTVLTYLRPAHRRHASCDVALDLRLVGRHSILRVSGTRKARSSSARADVTIVR